VNPKIRGTVAWLNANGFRTCDSGDGATHDYECDRDYPYVVIQVGGAAEIVPSAHRLVGLLRGRGIPLAPVGQGDVWMQATYDPVDGTAMIELCGMDDDMLGDQ
jgi:hypothetical protein